MHGDIPAEKRAQWREWARREFGDDEHAVDLGTQFVLDSLVAGYSVDESMAIARTAARGEAPPAGSEPSKGQTNSTPAEPGYPTSDSEHLRGRVSLFRSRNELMGRQYGTVWNFRVDSWNQEGKHQPAVAVEMRGLRFSGSLGDGDWVEIPGRWRPGENMRVRRLRNITMNSPVASEGKSYFGLIIFLLVFAIVGVVALAVARG